MSVPIRLLIIEDEPEILKFLEASLEQSYQVKSAVTAKNGLKQCSRHPPDLVILDLGLPDMDGKDVIASIRAWGNLPIIILSARDQEAEKVASLELGADDYLTKPFGTAELMARIKAALRRVNRRDADGGDVYEMEDLQVDLTKRLITLAGQPLQLTPTEYDLLSCLVRKAGQVVTQSELLREVWGQHSQNQSHYLRIYIQHLRQKLNDDPLAPRFIFTEPGVGYRLRAD